MGTYFVAEVSVPIDVRQFLMQHVRSVSQLEILLLLSASPERWWTPGEVYKAVLSNEELVGQTLESFQRSGLLRRSEAAFQFSPASEAIKMVIGNLTSFYRTYPNRIVQSIYEAPVSEINEFARAFRLRKKP